MSIAIVLLIAATVGLFTAMYGLQTLGYRRGRARAVETTNDERDGLGVVEGAVFALLGLLLAFQFGGAAERLSQRRAHAIQESNDIGTAYLRLDLLPPEDAARQREAFRRYIAARILAMESRLDRAKSTGHHAAAVTTQQEIWRDVVATFAKQPDHAAELLLLPSLNEMFDTAEEREAVTRMHGSVAVQVFLIVLALIAAVLAGYSMSRSAQRPTLHMVLFAAVITITIYFIFDMEFPRLGLIRIGAADQPLYDLRDAMK